MCLSVSNYCCNNGKNKVFNALFLCICCATVWLGAGGVNYVSCVYFWCMVAFTARWETCWRTWDEWHLLGNNTDVSSVKERKLKEMPAHRNGVHEEPQTAVISGDSASVRPLQGC